MPFPQPFSTLRFSSNIDSHPSRALKPCMGVSYKHTMDGNSTAPHRQYKTSTTITLISGKVELFRLKLSPLPQSAQQPLPSLTKHQQTTVPYNEKQRKALSTNRNSPIYLLNASQKLSPTPSHASNQKSKWCLKRFQIHIQDSAESALNVLQKLGLSSGDLQDNFKTINIRGVYRSHKNIRIEVLVLKMVQYQFYIRSAMNLIDKDPVKPGPCHHISGVPE